MKETLGKDETVKKTVRKHWFIPLIQSIQTSLLFILPLLLLFFLWGRKIMVADTEVAVSFGHPSFIIFGISLWGLVLWLRFWSFWTDHHLDGWVITNRRIIDIDQRGFFRREVSSFRLERLQDVTVEVSGIIPTLLHFGDVHVQTAGADREFVLRIAPHPKEVKSAILDVYNELMERDIPSVGADGLGSRR